MGCAAVVAYLGYGVRVALACEGYREEETKS